MESKDLHLPLPAGVQSVIDKAAELQNTLKTANPELVKLEISLAIVFGTPVIVDLPRYPRW